MKIFLFLAFVLAVLPASATVSVTFNAPSYPFSALAGSVRTYNVGISGGTGNLVNWTVSGTTGGASATLSASTNALPVVTVTFGATAGTCSVTGGIGTYVFSSTATVTIQAQSVDDVTKTASTTVNVCSTPVQVFVVPFYRTLYVNQKADLQSYVVGSTNLNVTWSLGACTGSAAGALTDTANRDTVFSGTGTGRCTITATSTADGTKTATAVMYVSGNALPSYAVTPNQTEPVDCSVDADLTGTTYEVGPARAFTTIQSVPLNTAPAGSTVRIHNDDGSGVSPTTYHEYFQISSHNGTATQPIRVCGVPDSLGNLPVVDAANATGASWVSAFSAAGLGVASIAGPAFGFYQAGNPANRFDIIEGLHLKNARPGNTYTTPSGTPGTAWIDGASCINVRSGYQLVFIGNDADNCSNGIFSDANMNNNAWGGNVLATLWEGNHIHSAGVNTEFGDHQFYLQGWLTVSQFNRIDLYTSGALGSNVKLRELGDVFRYNYIGTGAQRQMDMVELQDSGVYEAFETYLSFPGDTTCVDSLKCQGDTMDPNILAAWQEAYHQHFVYGNISNNSTALLSVHFSEDHDGGMTNRLGFLYFYNNTFNATGPSGFGGVTVNQAIFDTTGGGGNAYNNFEFPQIQAANNIAWTPSTGILYWNVYAPFIGAFQTNLMNTNWGSISTPINGGSISGQTGTGWSSFVDAFSYPLSVPLNPHMTGISAGNFLTTGTQPFDSTTFAPPTGSAAISAGTSLTGAMAVMPVRFQYNPNTSRVTGRTHPTTIGALDQSGNSAGGAVLPSGMTVASGTKIQ